MGLDVVVLCGGRGTRAYPDTAELPKALLPVGGRPILDHLLEIYAGQGHTRFVLAAGHLQDKLREHYAATPPGMDVEVLDTGIDTGTGARLRMAAAAVSGPRFFATYADGLADLDLSALLAFHISREALVTVTTVPLRSQYGTVVGDDSGRVTGFREKPVLPEHRVNAGFFVVERAALASLEGDDLERETLPALSRGGRLFSYRHPGFWMSMDTYKDRVELDALAAAGAPPWERRAGG